MFFRMNMVELLLYKFAEIADDSFPVTNYVHSLSLAVGPSLTARLIIGKKLSAVRINGSNYSSRLV